MTTLEESFDKVRQILDRVSVDGHDYHYQRSDQLQSDGSKKSTMIEYDDSLQTSLMES